MPLPMTEAGPMQRIELAPGYEISRVIRGGWQLAGGHGAVDRRRAVADMVAFVDAGITTFDCADIYTGVEELIGAVPAALPQRCAARRRSTASRCTPSSCPTSTSWRRRPRPMSSAHHRPVAEAPEARAARPRAVPLVGLRRAAAGSRRRCGWTSCSARARSTRLGGTNFDTTHMLAISSAGVPLVSMQVQYSLLDAGPRSGMVAAAPRAWRLACSATARWPAASSATLAGRSRSRGAVREPLADQVQAGHRRVRRLGAVPGAAAVLRRDRRPARRRHRHGGERARCSTGRRWRRSSSARATARTLPPTSQCRASC